MDRRKKDFLDITYEIGDPTETLTVIEIFKKFKLLNKKGLDFANSYDPYNTKNETKKEKKQ